MLILINIMFDYPKALEGTSVQRVSRRSALAGIGAMLALPVLAACQPRVVERPIDRVVTRVVERVVEKPVERVVTQVIEKQIVVERVVTAVPASSPGREIILYSGRKESLVGDLMKRFEARSGIKAKVRYGGTAELAATILEEGRNSPADSLFAQDAGALGAIAREGMFVKLPADLLNRVDPRFRSPIGEWVGISGRARTVVYNTESLRDIDLPDTILGFTDPKWRGKIGWAPTNGSFQAFVTAFRVSEGKEATRNWLQGIKDNEPRAYENNSTIVQAVAAGEAQVGFVNHYYVYRLLGEDPNLKARNYHPRAGGPGAMINIAGAGILKTSKNPEAAGALLGFLLSPEAQLYFVNQTFEYPLIEGVNPLPDLLPLKKINHPNIDLSDLDDLKGTLSLLRDVGIL